MILLFSLCGPGWLLGQVQQIGGLARQAQPSDVCGSDVLHRQLMLTDPGYAAHVQAFQQLVRTEAPGFQRSLSTIKIPVVVHVLSDGTAASAISDEEIREAIRVANNRFRKVPGTVGDGAGVDTGIEFALAVRDPDGNCTTGITRTDMTGNAAYMANGAYYQEAGLMKLGLAEAAGWDPTRYYNIYLVSEIDGPSNTAGGFANRAEQHGLLTDGAVIKIAVIRPFNSMVLAHELGHAFSLPHTFDGDDGGSTCPDNDDCTTDGDGICDTPPHVRNLVCLDPSTPNPCMGGAPLGLVLKNTMNYVDGQCANMFTNGQMAVMQLSATYLRVSLLAQYGNLSLVPPVAPAGLDIIASKGFVCPGQTISLRLSGSCLPDTYLNDSDFPGITYSWTVSNGASVQTSSASRPTFTVATTGPYTVAVTVTTPAGSASHVEQGVFVVPPNMVMPACTPTFQPANVVPENRVHLISFNTLFYERGPVDPSPAYEDHMCSRNTIVRRGESYAMRIGWNVVTVPFSGRVFVDFNNNGVIEATEWMAYFSATSPLYANAIVGTVQIPWNAVTDVPLRMRIITTEGSISAGQLDCSQPLINGSVMDFAVYVASEHAGVSIAASPSGTIPYGTGVVFTATPDNGGATPTYTWFRNDVAVGTGVQWSSFDLVQGDRIRCEMTSSLASVIGSPASSNLITMAVTGTPLTDFTASSRRICAGGQVQFFDSSQLQPTSWSWSFPGGSPSSSGLKDPVVSYATPGLKSVTLTASNAYGSSTVTKTWYITAYTPPVASCGVSRTAPPNVSVGIRSVQLHTLNHNSDPNDDAHVDLTCSKMVTLTPSTTYSFSILVSSGMEQWVRVYIDYNGNGVLDDAGELVVSNLSGYNVLQAWFTTPASFPAMGELVRMRVISDVPPVATTPCANNLWAGQAEDYGVVLAPTPSVATGTIPGTGYCQGESIPVPYTTISLFPSGNVFMAQLSDATGSFANPVNIGSLPAMGSGTIQAVIPASTPAGSGYRIRVVGQNPFVIGSDNGTDITVHSLPTAVCTVPPLLTCTTTSVQLTVNNCTFVPGRSFLWTGPNGFTSTQQCPSVSQPGTYTVTVTNNFTGCKATCSVNVAQQLQGPPASCSASGMISCTNSSVQLQVNNCAFLLGASYAWYGPGGYMSTAQCPTVSVPGTYLVIVTQNITACQTQCFTTVQPAPGYLDSDNDGLCDTNDPCPNAPGGPGSPCDDGNAATSNDVLNGSCQCLGLPVNDNVCNAIPLALGLNGPFSNVGATVQPGEPQPPASVCGGQAGWCIGQVPSQSVWFTFVAPPSGRVKLGFGPTATWDSQLAIWSASSCQALTSGGGTLIAANDDIAGSPYHAEILPVCVTPGQTYHVQVDGYGSTTNSAFQLLLEEAPPVLAAGITAGTSVVCPGSGSTVTITGTPGATVTYSVDHGASQSVNLGSGSVVLPTPALGHGSTYRLVSMTNGSCSRSFSGADPSTSASITVQHPPALEITQQPPTACVGAPVTLSATAAPTFELMIAGSGYLDEVSWTLTDSMAQVLASGGNYVFGSSNTVLIQAPMSAPFTLQIETMGAYNDNALWYELRCEGGVLVEGPLAGGQTFAEGDLECYLPYSPALTWSPGNITAPSITFQPSSAGALFHQVSAASPLGCQSQDTLTVMVSPSPAISSVSASPAAICPGASVQLEVLANGAVAYCTGPFYSVGCSEGDVITQVAFAGIQRSSGCDGVQGHSYHPTVQGSVVAGQSYGFSMTTSATYAQGGAAWVDWDQDGVFEAQELIVDGYTGAPGATYATASYAVPPNARNGRTRLRVRCAYNANPAASPCGPLVYGEVEDYPIVVTGGIPGLTYAWSPAIDLDNGAVRDPIASNVQSPETYSVVVTDAGGCASTASVTVQTSGQDTDADGVIDCTDNCPLVPGQIGSPCDDGNANTINDVLDGSCICQGTTAIVAVQASVVLEGAYVQADGLMRDNLRTLGTFPLSQPYAGAPWNHAGTETISPAVLAVTGPDAVVDWVLVDVRTATAPYTVLQTKAGLLQRDGDIVAPDGITPLLFNQVNGTYSVSVRHRNHLGIMTAPPVTLSGAGSVVDLRVASTPTYGTDARKNLGGAFPVLVMWAGDVSGNGQLKYTGSGNDRDPILTRIGGSLPTSTVSGYWPEDCTLDGSVKYTGSGNDRDVILLNIGGTVPTATRSAQLP